MKVVYSFEPTRFFRDPLARQVNEGVRINDSLAEGTLCALMNSRAEFRQERVPRVEIVRGLRWLEIVFEIFFTRKRFTFIYIITAFMVAT